MKIVNYPVLVIKYCCTFGWVKLFKKQLHLWPEFSSLFMFVQLVFWKRIPPAEVEAIFQWIPQSQDGLLFFRQIFLYPNAQSIHLYSPLKLLQKLLEKKAELFNKKIWKLIPLKTFFFQDFCERKKIRFFCLEFWLKWWCIDRYRKPILEKVFSFLMWSRAVDFGLQLIRITSNFSRVSVLCWAILVETLDPKSELEMRFTGQSTPNMTECVCHR